MTRLNRCNTGRYIIMQFEPVILLLLLLLFRIENDRSKDLKLRRLERENEELRGDLLSKTARIQREISKRDRMESSLSGKQINNLINKLID